MRLLCCLFLLGVISTSNTQQPGWCRDTLRWCYQWALQGECYISRPFMTAHCSASCGFCIDAKCVDRNKLCPYWASTGGCKSSNPIVLRNCPVSCGACAPEPPRLPPARVPLGRPGSQGLSASQVQPNPERNFQRPPSPQRQPLPQRLPNSQPQPTASSHLFPSLGFGGLSRLPSITRPSFKCGAPYTTGSVRRTRQVSEPPKTSSGQAGGIQGFADTEEGSVSCGATVISDRYILTAAHCVFSNSPHSVRLGDLDLSQDNEANSRPADYEVEVIIVHPDYTFDGYNDLALIKTKRPIEFNEAVFPFCIPEKRPDPRSTVTGAGFGYVNETSTATHLQEVEMQVVDSAQCETQYMREHSQSLRRWYPNLLRGSDIMCAGAPGKSACRGDAGGPLFQTDEYGKSFLVGIISRGLPCNNLNKNNTMPNFFISVADHVDFINSVIYEEV